MFCFATRSISNDVGSQLTQLVVLNKEAASTFRPRLNENKALLPVKLRLTGPEGLPGAAGIQVGQHEQLGLTTQSPTHLPASCIAP